MTARSRFAARVSGATFALWMVSVVPGRSFPLLDPTNDTAAEVPTGTALPSTDAHDLQHQLQLANGLATSAAGGWILQPRLDMEELFTDNVLQVHSPRRWDLGNFLSPGIALLGDEPRVQARLDYAPTLSMYDRTPELNALSQQLNATALITVVPDIVYVDTRALAGVQSRNGGIGGIGSIGATGNAGLIAGSTVGGTTAATGLNKDNETQTTSVGISPYALGRFGDWGNGKIGASVDLSHSNTISGFAASPFPTGGGSGTAQSLLTTEQIAQFTSGDYFDQFQDSLSINLTQSSTDAGEATAGGAATTTGHTTSSRQIISDQLSYAVNHELVAFASIGHEDISYSGENQQKIDDLTWQVGATWTPNPDSTVTVSYGHQEGANSATVNAHYALTARTTLTASYSNTLGTQLENLQRQLNQSSVSANGSLVNSLTGAPALVNANTQPVQGGLYRFSNLTFGATTVLDRDVISLSVLLSNQTATGGTAAANSSVDKTLSAQWTRSVWPDLTLSTSLSYTLQSATALTGGNASTSLAATAALQYTISETLLASLRYSYFERSGATALLNVYQNLVILGITKTF